MQNRIFDRSRVKSFSIGSKYTWHKFHIFFTFIVLSWIVLKKLYQLFSYKLNFSAILPISYIYCNPLFSIRHRQSSLFIDTTQHYYCVKISNICLVMPNNTLFKMFFTNLFTCFFITWSLCKLFHSYFESLFMSMHDKQTKCCGCVTSHSQQIGQPPCLALTDLWTSNVWNTLIQVTEMGVFFSFQGNLFEANQV